MKVYNYNQIRPYDTAIIVASAQLGTSILTLPRTVTEAVQTSDGWIAILISGLIMLLVSWILGQVLIQYPGWNLVTISSRLIGVKLTQLFFLLFAAVIMCYFAIVIRMTGLLTKLYFFELTPLEIVGVLGVHTTMNVYVPTIELAKEAEIPGGFFDRLQSIFFAVWILAIFSSAVFALDITTLLLQSVFQKIRKMSWILGIAPIAYLLSMIPRNNQEVFEWGSSAIVVLFSLSVTYTFVLFITAKWKGRRRHG